MQRVDKSPARDPIGAPARPTRAAHRARRYSAHREHDVPAVRLVARGRVLLATAAVIVGSLLPSGNTRRDAVLYVIGVFWVPWSGWLALDADRHAPRFTRMAGAAGDLAVLLSLGVLVPGSLVMVGMGSGIVVLVSAYTGSALEGVGLSLGAVVVFTVGSYVTPPRDVPRPLLVILYATVLMILLAVLGRGSSERRRASLQSQRLLGRSEAVLERVADGVIVTDARGMVLEANPAARRLMDPSGRHPSGRHCEEVLGLRMGERPLDCSRGCALLLLDGGREDDEGKEVWRTTPDGRRQPLLANVCTISDEHGEVEEVVHSLRDITTLKQADEAKTMFLATASHELKTPLTVIRGFGEMLLDMPEMPDEAARAANAIVRRAEELSTIVDGLLLSSRIESGRLDLDVRELQVAPILRERGESLMAATGRTVEILVPDGGPEVDADPAAVTTVVDHLLDNAVKYSPHGGSVVLEAQVAPAEVRIRISDSGIGMDQGQAAHCFEKFWQAESTDDRRFRGTGIGLYIVRSLVEAMGGTITVESSPGKGTTFVVSLVRSDHRAAAVPDVAMRDGEDSIVREFMRQLGIPAVSS
ncbi:MAG: PAS domain-containing sensor histidine kinase [Actinomycetota bacterium]|nr:PAS domain-containing sensor histidine kinase [Actinomycetota bacterium]